MTAHLLCFTILRHVDINKHEFIYFIFFLQIVNYE